MANIMMATGALQIMIFAGMFFIVADQADRAFYQAIVGGAVVCPAVIVILWILRNELVRK